MINISELFKLGEKKGLTDLEAYITKNNSVDLKVYEGKVEQNTISTVSKISLRGVYQEKMGEVQFEHISDSTIEHMIDKLIDNAKALTANEPAIIFEGSKSYRKINIEIFDFDSIETQQKVKDLLLLEKKIRENSHVENLQAAVYHENSSETSIINTKGLNLSRKNTMAYAYAIGVFKDGEEKITAYEVDIFKDYREFDPSKLASKILEKGLSKIGAKSIETKEYPVVFSNETFSDLLSVFLNLFSAEAALRNLTPFKEKVNKKIFQEDINLVDDPFSEKAYFQYSFDDEGVACNKKSIVKNGIFQGFINNLKTAAMAKTDPTGNGFGGGVSMSNLYLEPGDKNFDQLIEKIDQGVYITGLAGLHAGVKTISGEFSLQANGFKIEKGKLSRPVKMIVVSGNFFELLNSVSGIGNDLKFNTSGVGSPSLHVKKLSISGQK